MYSLAVAVHVVKQSDIGIHLSWCATTHTSINHTNIGLHLSRCTYIHIYISLLYLHNSLPEYYVLQAQLVILG